MSTSTTPIIPSRNPGEDNNLTGGLRNILRKTFQNIHGQLPASVVVYDRVKNRAQVKIMIPIVGTNGTIKSRDPIASIPVLALGGGGFCINFPLKPGDFGWIRANDRDISLFLQSLAESKPNTFRLHSFEDGMFVPDAFNKYTFDQTDDAANMVIQSYDGTVKITLGPNTINIDASQNIKLTAPNITLAASTETHFTGGGTAVFDVATTFNQPVTINDGATMNDATIAGFEFAGHAHSNGNGGANTGGVVS
jgi:hypothetical protein